jgi:ABC-2 type transport system permease protein
VSWVAIANKDFADAIRSRTLWVLVGIFVLVGIGASLAFEQVANGPGPAQGGPGMTDFVLFLRAPLSWLVPLLALLAGYKSIAGERASGSIKLLLSLPHDRLDVIVGKLAGRTAVVTAALGAGFIATFAGALVVLPDVDPAPFMAFAGLTFMLGATFVSIGICCSGLTRSTSRAAAGAVGAFALFTFVWTQIPRAIFTLLNDSTVPTPGNYPEWYFLVRRLSPVGAYNGAVFELGPGSDQLQLLLGSEPPVYLEGWVGLVVLAVWVVLPAGLGYLRFREVDL